MVVGAGGRGVIPLTMVLEGHPPLGDLAGGGAYRHCGASRAGWPERSWGRGEATHLHRFKNRESG